jgi:hypothetical protein
MKVVVGMAERQVLICECKATDSKAKKMVLGRVERQVLI